MKEYSILTIHSEELGRDVKIYIYLPKSYSGSKKSYPVLYMNDGQILFNDYEDHKDIKLGIMGDYLNNPQSPEIILVGVNSCETRVDELLPFVVESKVTGNFSGGKTNLYFDFIVNKLMPTINQTYRTIKSPESTGLLGISLGGTCSIYAATKYTEHFTIFGCVSNAFVRVKNEMKDVVRESDLSKINKMYLDVGTKESQNEEHSIAYIESNKEIYNILKEKLDPNKLEFKIIKDSQHIEEDWRKRFPDIISYLFEKVLN